METKLIFWGGNPHIQMILSRYIKNERPRHDCLGRKRLADVADDEPLFLVDGGGAYNYQAFRWHWHRIYPAASRHCPLHFRIHDIRHLFVTEWLLRARRTYGKDSPSYAGSRRQLSRIMGWHGRLTIDAYDHSLDFAASVIGDLAALQQEIAQQPVNGAAATPNTSGSGATSTRATAPEIIETVSSEDLDWIQQRRRT